MLANRLTWGANLGWNRLLSRSGRLKGDCGQDCPPHDYCKAIKPVFLVF
jgi:hypothetical protein